MTLVAHDPRWAALASNEARAIRRACGPALVHLHHIGSTAIAGIAAKPVLDLLGVARCLAAVDAATGRLEALGYAPRGEYGLPGRRYFTRSDPHTGERRVHLHCYAKGDPAIVRHLGFRDRLRARPALAAGYQAEKTRCATLHAHDSHAYTACKAAWIERALVDAPPSAERQPTGNDAAD